MNGTLLNIGKRYEVNVRVIFDQWLKLHLGLDALSNQKILKGVYCPCCSVMKSHLKIFGFSMGIVTNQLMARAPGHNRGLPLPVVWHGCSVAVSPI